jgi:hypothetical protein
VLKFSSNPEEDPNCLLYLAKLPDTNYPSSAQFVFIEGLKYVYARNSQYAKNWNSPVKNADGADSTVGMEVLKLIKKYRVKLKDGNLFIQRCMPHPLGAGHAPICYNMGLIKRMGRVGYAPYTVDSEITDAQLDSWIAQGAPSTYLFSMNIKLIFEGADYRNHFMAELRVVSGIMDEYMNDTFMETAGIGNAFMYGYAPDARINNQNVGLNEYPAAVLAKYGAQSGWLDGAATFSGLDYNLLKELGANTVSYHQNGKDPKQILRELLLAHKQAAAVGSPVAVIVAAVIAIINAIAAAIAAIMNVTKQRAETIEPGNVPLDFQPIGAPLQLAESDWDAGSGGGNEEGSNMGTMLMLGGAALLGYQLINNK